MGVDPVSLAINAAMIAANMAVTASQQFEGPRLDALQVTTADYGAPLNHVYGTRRLDGLSCIWAEPLTEIKRRRKTKGGKYNEYSYFGTWAVAVCDHEVDAVTRIWFDRNLVYDATGAGPITPFPELGALSQYITVYLGTSDQDVDPRMSATIDAEHGADSTPAYRGVCYIVFKDLPLEKLGNRLPQVSVEVVTSGADAKPYDRRDTQFALGSMNQQISFSPDRSRVLLWDDQDYEIWDASARALMIAGELDDSLATVSGNGSPSITNDGTIYISSSGLYAYPPDGVGAQVLAAAGTDGFVRTFALEDGNGDELIFIPRAGQTNGGHVYYPASNTLVALDLAAETGQTWDAKWAFVDGYGDVWLAGGEDSVLSAGPLTVNELALWRMVNVSGRAGPDFAIVTMPTAQGATVDLAAYHNLASDHFVVRWAGANQYLIDCTTFAITGSAALVAATDTRDHAFRWATPTDAATWYGETEFSNTDLSVIRTVDLDTWVGDAVEQTILYDRLNHALICGGSGPSIVWCYLDRVSGDGVTLQSIVENVAERCGLEAGDYDATDLTQTVQGYSWTQGSGKAILEPLLEAYDSEARPHDFKVEFLRRGDAGLGTIAVADMGAGGSTRYEVATTLDTDLPLKVSLTFADLDKDQQPNTALAQRAGAATDSRRELSLDASTLALDVDEARQKADGYLRRSWMKAQSYNLSLSRKWSKLEPGDAYTLTLDDVSRLAKLTRLEFGANGVLTTEWERYAPAVHGATALAGAEADGLTPAVLPSFGYTKGVVLDVPLVTDGDDGIIAYAAASPYSSDLGWPGAIIWRSDDGTTYDQEFASVATSQQGTIGYATTALPSALTTVWDEASTVTVTMFSGELTSATSAEVLNGANMALLGEELIGFRTATLVSAGVYTLSGLLRGQRGTEWATGSHASGDRFVLMETAQRGELEASDIGDTLYFRPITEGGSTGFDQSFVYTAASRKPYAPAHATAEDVSGDIVLEWVRRTRLGGSWRDYMDASLGETAEEYEVDILNGSGTVIRTIAGLSSETATYTAAQQTTDSNAGVTAKIYQIAPDLTLRGYPATVAI